MKEKIFRRATMADKKSIIDIYERAKGQPFTLWNENYPTEENVDNDIENGNLYVLEKECVIIGCISIEKDSDLEQLSCWEENDAQEFCRVVIDKGHNGHGYAKIMVEEIEKILIRQNCKAIHISVGVSNIPACKTYETMGYQKKEQLQIYGGMYYLCEKILKY